MLGMAAISAGNIFQRVSVGHAAVPMRESRAILDEGLHWITRNSLDGTADNFCRRIKKAGFNVVIPNVWHGRGVTWPTNLAPWDDRIGNMRGWDPLGRLLQSARKHELEVHPWFTVGLRQRDFLPEYASSRAGDSFDFHKREFREFITAIILDVVRRYPVQGVNLDFVRFDYPKPGHEEEQIKAVEQVVGEAAAGARTLRSEMVISADTAPWHPPIRQYGQDGPKWADEGLLDVLYSMQYQYAPDFNAIGRVKKTMKRPESISIIVGNYDTLGFKKTVVPRDPKRLAELINISRGFSGGNGVAVYYYGMLNDAQVETLRTTVFKEPAIPNWVRAGGLSRSKG